MRSARKDVHPPPTGPGADEVDQRKGIFPFGAPHPPDAELRSPGSLGGGPYEESGRGSPSIEGSSYEPGAIVGVDRAPPAEASEEARKRERAEPAGSLPPHREESARGAKKG